MVEEGEGSSPASGAGPEVTAYVPGASCLCLPQTWCVWGVCVYLLTNFKPD